jgi:hypothetical protein
MADDKQNGVINLAQEAIKKAPSGAIGVAIVIVTCLFSIGNFLKETGLSPQLVKLFEAHTQASTSLAQEVKENTSAIGKLVSKLDAQQEQNTRFVKQIENKITIIESRVEALEQSTYQDESKRKK